MADVSDSRIPEAYADVRNDNTDTNWALFAYSDDTSNTIVVADSGSGGLEEFKAALAKVDAGYGFLRFTVGNDELSKRAKFVFVSYTGPSCRVLRKARVSIHQADLKTHIKDFSIQIGIDDVHDLKESDILTQLKKAMGANYDRQASGY
ncbi:hypothetical protein H696_02342 [Fonticula alba]|uniref:ADF-H domain-containing protein n=1 Tax=Fonticula alba TaxID=691883 RepID=A0A058ZAH5_FONAL|nr:hypothetical protein H696_02342 [Fonticula alba]KCV71394.1 hypothetical protein H696_02342 [Fonticula alba]|eukprot:XP_009494517.1 hypothetical protein H696_02342 [Fonticula alba]